MGGGLDSPIVIAESSRTAFRNVGDFFQVTIEENVGSVARRVVTDTLTDSLAERDLPESEKYARSIMADEMLHREQRET